MIDILIVRGVFIKGTFYLLYFSYLSEEVLLSRGISQLASTHKIIPMISRKGKDFPTHVLYVDEIFVFFRVNRKSLINLIEFLHVYDSISG